MRPLFFGIRGRFKTKTLESEDTVEAHLDLKTATNTKPILTARALLNLCPSLQMREVVEEIRKVSQYDGVPVVAQGESGVGKDLVAQAIHEQSCRSGRPLVVVDCTTLTETLVANELFGHERGAFTDAREKRIGRLEQADGGTLFIDEIGELPLNFQPKFLRALENRKFVRVGGNTEVSSNFRLVVATNRNLEQMVKDKLFRSDLYYRLSVVSITIPPLRCRRDDILPLVEHFLSRHAEDSVSLGQEARALLEAYHWPGNVRELSNVIKRAVVMADFQEILPKHISLIETASTSSTGAGEPLLTEEEFLKTVEAYRKRNTLTYTGLTELIQRQMIMMQLDKRGRTIASAATALGISRSALNGQMKRFGISREISES